MSIRLGLLAAVLSWILLSTSGNAHAQPGEEGEKEYICEKCNHQFPNPTVPTKCPKCGAKFGSVTKNDGTTSKTKVGEDRETLRTILMVVGGASVLVAVILGIVRFAKSQSAAKKPKKKGNSSKRSRDDD
jgi:uncharacterized membrane protein YvbJ